MAGSQLFDLQLQPVRVPPSAQGAMALSIVTGCDIQYVGQAPRIGDMEVSDSAYAEG